MIHALLDAARMGQSMVAAKESTTKFISLYKGRSEENLVDFAPHLFTITDQQKFATWIVDQGWGKSWGVYVESAAPPANVYRHFRKFLLVRTEIGQELYFRFYDPRVLRQFLPTCDTQQLTNFFGPIRYFLLEDDDPAFAIRFRLEQGDLRQDRISRTEAEQVMLC